MQAGLIAREFRERHDISRCDRAALFDLGRKRGEDRVWQAWPGVLIRTLFPERIAQPAQH